MSDASYDDRTADTPHAHRLRMLAQSARQLFVEMARVARGSDRAYQAVQALEDLVGYSQTLTRGDLCDAISTARIPGKYAGETDDLDEYDKEMRKIVLAALHVAGEHHCGSTSQAHKARQSLRDAIDAHVRAKVQRRAKWIR